MTARVKRLRCGTLSSITWFNCVLRIEYSAVERSLLSTRLADVVACIPRAAIQHGSRARAAPASRAPQHRPPPRIVSALKLSNLLYLVLLSRVIFNEIPVEWPPDISL